MAAGLQADPIVVWDAQPKQARFITCPADDVGFGGARGGGKSDGILGDWLSHEDLYGSSAIGLCFRRELTQLKELIARSKEMLPLLGHTWHEQDKYFTGPKGGRLRFAYLERDADADAYQGHSYTRLYPEEMGTFPMEAPINKLQATLRSGNGVPCQMKGTMNPGGAGHQWVKARYRLDEYPKGMEVFRFEFVNPFTKKIVEKTRVFIPSLVVDNRYLGDDYVASLYQSGSEELVKAWLFGDWSVVEGAFFDCWDPQKHVIRPFKVPKHWVRFRSLDWGSARPFSVGWWAAASESVQVDGQLIPKGALVKYRQWYGKSAPNVGLKMDAESVAQGIKERTPEGEKIAYDVADPSIFSEDGGPSIAERMWTAAKIGWRKADNKRVTEKGRMGGWDQLRSRMQGDDWELIDGVFQPSTPNWRPMVYWFSTCYDSIRTLPALQHDEAKPEDVDTDMEDHAPDEDRYAVMSRPYTRPKPRVQPKITSRLPTMNELHGRIDRIRPQSRPI